mmetsp:Transcript_41613/g.109624  ORF Transcript_41613/g.109624 Transcript_41613/m.109624 type:complete len:287 (+) Transcript_41613:1172-2032(+)
MHTGTSSGTKATEPPVRLAWYERAACAPYALIKFRVVFSGSKEKTSPFILRETTTVRTLSTTELDCTDSVLGRSVPGLWFARWRSVMLPLPSTMIAQGASAIAAASKPRPNQTSAGPEILIVTLSRGTSITTLNCTRLEADPETVVMLPPHVAAVCKVLKVVDKCPFFEVMTHPAGNDASTPSWWVTLAAPARILSPAAKHSDAPTSAVAPHVPLKRVVYSPSTTFRIRVVTGHSSSPLYRASGPSVGAKEFRGTGPDTKCDSVTFILSRLKVSICMGSTERPSGE